VREHLQSVVAELDVERRDLGGVELVRQADVARHDHAVLGVEGDLLVGRAAFGFVLGPHRRLYIGGILEHRGADGAVEDPAGLHREIVDALLASSHVDDDADVTGADTRAAAAGHRAEYGHEAHQRHQPVARQVLLVGLVGTAAELDELGQKPQRTGDDADPQDRTASEGDVRRGVQEEVGQGAEPPGDQSVDDERQKRLPELHCIPLLKCSFCSSARDDSRFD